MIVFPAIDLYEGRAVRLLKGDYSRMNVYSDHPEEVAGIFQAEGATHIHLVDLEGAREGRMPNLGTVVRIKRETGLFCEVGGGIRNMDRVKTCLGEGIDRVILGTAAVKDPVFLDQALAAFGDRIAVGVDIRDGMVAVSGWTEKSALPFLPFCQDMARRGVATLICTDISRDGAMRGTNRELYADLRDRCSMNITASGGVSSMEDVKALAAMDLYGAIIGKAYYTGAINLKEAIEVSA